MITIKIGHQPSADDLRRRIMTRMNLNKSEDASLDIPSYEEICKNTRISTSEASNDSDDSYQKNRRQKSTTDKKKEQDLSSVKIKTLAEIRAEKKLREQQEKQNTCDKPDSDEISSTIAEVTSTSKIEDMTVGDVSKKQEIDSRGAKRKSDTGEGQIVRKKPKLRRPQIVDSDSTVSSVGGTEKDEKNEKTGVKRSESRDTSKLDETLLLDEDDMEYQCFSNVSLQAEDDLLKDIDEFLA